MALHKGGPIALHSQGKVDHRAFHVVKESVVVPGCVERLTSSGVDAGRGADVFKGNGAGRGANEAPTLQYLVVLAGDVVPVCDWRTDAADHIPRVCQVHIII